MNSTRQYTMRARAAAVAETRQKILDATLALAAERLFVDIGLEAVARRSGVSVQTVLRQFGSRAALFEATAEHGARVVAAERQTPAGDVPAAIRVLLEHYERRGDATILLLAQESTDPVVAGVVENGRALHRKWVADVFAPSLTRLDEAAQDELTDLLVVATDVYAWKLLRRDRRLSPEDVERRMNGLVAALLAAVDEPPHPPESHTETR